MWAVPPPDLTQVAPNLQPLAAIVAEALDESSVGRLKRVADDAERDIATKRAELAVTTKPLMAMMARAEIDGWELEVEGPVQRLAELAKELRDHLDRLRKTMRGTIARLQAAKVPGANTLHNSERRIIEAFNGLTNDVDDYAAEFRAVRDRMKTYRKVASPVEQAENAYREAFGKILGEGWRISSRSEEVDGSLMMCLTVPVGPELLSHPDRLLASEAKVHDEVAFRDNSLVGKVAIDYVPLE